MPPKSVKLLGGILLRLAHFFLFLPYGKSYLVAVVGALH